MKAEEPAMSERAMRPRSIAFYVVFAAALYAIIRAHSSLAPILLSFFLIVLITLAVNPIVQRLRTWAGGRKRATGLIMVGLLTIGGLSVWAAVGPIKQAATTLSERLPAYWERLQKPLIKMEQKSVISEEKLQEEVSEEIARETPEKGKEAPAPPEVEPIPPEPPPLAEVPTKPEKEDGSIRSTLGEIVQGLFGQINGVAHSTTEMLIVLVTVFFGVTFTLMNPRPIFGALFSVVPEHHHVRTLTVMVRIAKFVPRWAGAVLISMLTIGSLFFLLMWPIFGLSDALMLGLIAFLPTAPDDDLDRLARCALLEQSEGDQHSEGENGVTKPLPLGWK